ncbi:hypothetical protein [Streptomyces sp. MMG1121]|uniref:hypothetical protein n=1 Tax=Streptomyces sp. MMG1121 TaxID=1415544 RepID=UPI0006AE3C39|nr:hypothetical protein [Streptomyces sp. MMG1121]
MIPTRRIVAALGLPAGVTGCRPAGDRGRRERSEHGETDPVTTLDALAVSDIPAAHRARVPRVSKRIRALNRIDQLNELHQVTGLAAPATGLLPAVEA